MNPRGGIRADFGEGFLVAARAGLGIAWLPDFFVKEDIADRHLVRVLERCETEPLGIWAVYPLSCHLSLKVRVAVDRLTEAMKA